MIDDRKRKILIISEGLEEKIYIDKILSFPNIKTNYYSFDPSANVKGNGKIVARYQYEIQTGFYDVVLIFCDGDNGSEQFKEIVKTIGNIFFENIEDGFKVFIFANPTSMQILLSHFGDVALKNVGKMSNAAVIKKMTGVQNYDASKQQIEDIVKQIHFKDLSTFKERLRTMSGNIDETPSTNFLLFLDRFENEDDSWIEEINSLFKKR